MSWDLVDFHISDTSGDHKCLFFAKQHFPNWESVPVQVWTGNKCETLDSEQTGSNYGSWCRWLQQSISPVWHNLGSKQGKLLKKHSWFEIKMYYCTLAKTTLAGIFLQNYPTTIFKDGLDLAHERTYMRVYIHILLCWEQNLSYMARFSFLGAKPKLYGPVFFFGSIT